MYRYWEKQTLGELYKDVPCQENDKMIKVLYVTTGPIFLVGARTGMRIRIYASAKPR